MSPDGDGVVLTFGDGLPVVADHDDTDRGGGAALSALATPGSYHVELYESSSGDLDPVHYVNEFRVARGAPAEQVADAPGLVKRTRWAAPDDRDAGATDPVAAFLADEERVETIREQAREEAERRATELGFDDSLKG